MKKFLFLIIVIFFSKESFSTTIVDTDGSYAVTALNACGDYLVMGHFDGKIRIFDPFKSSLINTLEGHTKQVTSISSDIFGRYILSSSQDGSLIFWEVKTGKMIKRIFKPGMAFRASALHPSGKYAFASFASTVYVWDTSTWENVYIWERIDGDVYSISINETGKIAALGGKNGKINIYSAPKGDKIKTLKAGNDIVLSTDFAVNSDLLISGGYDKTARVWDINKGEIVKEFSRHNDTVRAVGASANGKIFVTAGDDGLVVLWNINGNSENFAAQGSLPATSLAVDDNLRFVASGKGAIFQDNKYATLWYPYNRRQSRNIYVFKDALAVLSNLGYVNGAGSFASYLSVNSGGRNYPFAQVAKKYNRPERMVIEKTKKYETKRIKPAKINKETENNKKLLD